MTMQAVHSPKPKIFGEGYGEHVSYNYALMKKFFWLGWKMLINMLIPGVFYERAHWEVIELYHKMRGFRHGTVSDHRCDKCGGDTPSSDERYKQYTDLKELEEQGIKVEDPTSEEPAIQSAFEKIQPGEINGADHPSLGNHNLLDK